MLPPIADPPRVPHQPIFTSCSWLSITVASSLLTITESASAFLPITGPSSSMM